MEISFTDSVQKQKKNLKGYSVREGFSEKRENKILKRENKILKREVSTLTKSIIFPNYCRLLTKLASK